MIAHDIAAAHRGKADGRGIALAGHALAPIHRACLEIAPQRLSDNFAHAQRRARGGIDFQPMVRFDDLDVVALRKNARGNIEQFEDGIGADAHVRREDDRDFLRRLGNRLLAVRLEASRADDDRRPMLAAQGQMRQRPLRACEVDQAIGGGNGRFDIGSHRHIAA